MKLKAELTFTQGYIAHPYWPELEKFINVQKESGTKRAKSEATRVKALNEYLKKKGLTMADLEALERRAVRPFYTAADVYDTEHPEDEIVIPSHQMTAMLANGCDVASSSIKLCKVEQLRSLITAGHVWTGKTKADGVYSRFVVVKTGSGQVLSNQRSLRENPYIGKFTGTLELTFSEDQLKPDKVRDFVSFCGSDIGVGASRKMGWGRFTARF